VSPANSKSDTNYFKAGLNFGAKCNQFRRAGSSYFRLTAATATLCLPQLDGILGKSGVIARFSSSRHDRRMRPFNYLTARSALILRELYRMLCGGGSEPMRRFAVNPGLAVIFNGVFETQNSA
jgi:hypothetical protein